MINIKKLDVTETVFQRINHRGEYQVIAVDRLFKYCEKINHYEVRLEVTQAKAADIKRLRNIEPHRLTRLRQEDLRVPLLLIEDFGEIDMIDGHHRYIRKFLTGVLFARAYQVMPVIWKQYLVKGVPAKTA